MAVEAEWAELNRLLAPFQSHNSARLAELATAYAELDDTLSEISVSLTENEAPFGSLWSLHPDRLAEVELGLRQRACFFHRLDELPSWLWSQPSRPLLPSPSASSAASLLDLRSAVSLLTAKAWLSARHPNGAEAAAHDFERALALLRIADDGTTISLLVRASLEALVSEAVHRVVAEGIVDPAVVRDALEQELLAALEQDRMQLAIASDAQLFVAYLTEELRTSSAGDWESAHDIRDLAGALRAQRQVLSSRDLRRAVGTMTTTEGQAASLVRTWRSLVRTDFERQCCLEELLAL